MKICLVNNLWGATARGGAEKIVSQLADLIIAAGHDLIIITAKADAAPKNSFSATAATAKVYYLNTGYVNLVKWPKYWRLLWHLWQLVNPWRSRRLQKILKAEKVELVLSHNLLGLGFGLGRASQELNLKHFHWLHDVQLLHPSGLMFYGQERRLDSFYAKIYSSLSKKLLGNPAAVISPSAWLLNEHERRGWFSDSQTIILANPLEAPLTKKEFSSGPLTFLFAGQVEVHKGIFLLLNAWQKFKAFSPEAKLLIAGAGTVLKRAKKMAVPNVEFLGHLSEAELAKLMNQADCLVVPSLCYENSPTVIHEAAARGLPVIASALGGNKELLAADYLFTPEIDDLAAKLFWVSERRRELLPPDKKFVALEKYWQKIKELL